VLFSWRTLIRHYLNQLSVEYKVVHSCQLLYVVEIILRFRKYSLSTPFKKEVRIQVSVFSVSKHKPGRREMHVLISQTWHLFIWTLFSKYYLIKLQTVSYLHMHFLIREELKRKNTPWRYTATENGFNVNKCHSFEHKKVNYPVFQSILVMY